MAEYDKTNTFTLT